MFRIITRCLVFGLTLLCVPAFAQIAPNTYGTQSETSTTIFAYDFQPYGANTTWADSPLFNRYVNNGNGCCFVAGVRLPNGAAVTGLEIDGCDFSVLGSLVAELLTCPPPAGSACTGLVGLTETGDAAAPGCGVYHVNINPQTVDNVTTSYFIEAGNPNDISGTVRFRAVRVFYKLQVSPPPGTATFGDVPTTHLFYQYIEALASAGITAGCGGGNYCPDAPLTRGQMAVFLSKALGLHWPN